MLVKVKSLDVKFSFDEAQLKLPLKIENSFWLYDTNRYLKSLLEGFSLKHFITVEYAEG